MATQQTSNNPSTRRVVQLKLFGSGQSSQAVQNNPSYLMNLYGVGVNDLGDKSDAYFKTWGTELFTSISSDTIRGLLEVNDNIYAIAGNRLFIVSATGTTVHVGTLSTSVGRVSMDTDGDRIVIDDGLSRYSYLISTGVLTTISDSDLSPSGFVQLQAYRAISAIPGTARFQWSDLNDYTSYDPTSYATAESIRSHLICAYKGPNDLLLMGENVTEPWRLDVDANIPYSKRLGISIPYGCMNKWTVCTNNNNVIWLSKNDQGRLSIISVDANYNIQTLTTNSTSEALHKLTTITDAYAFIIQMKEKLFYAIHFPTDQKSFLLNLATKEFSQWSSWQQIGNLSDGTAAYTSGRHLASHVVTLSDKTIVADYRAGRLLTLSPYVPTDYACGTDNSILCKMRSPIIHDDTKRFSIYTLTIDAAVGESYLSSLADDGTVNQPKMTIALSKDGGRTYSTKRTVSFGHTGDYKTSIKTRKWGLLKNGSVEISCNHNSFLGLFGAYIEAGVE